LSLGTEQECYYFNPSESYGCASASNPCDPSPCGEEEECVILESYPPQLGCEPTFDKCGGSCLEFQVCR